MRTITVYVDEAEKSRKRKRRALGAVIGLAALLAVAQPKQTPVAPAPAQPGTVTVVKEVRVPVLVAAEFFGPPAPPTVVITVPVEVKRPDTVNPPVEVVTTEPPDEGPTETTTTVSTIEPEPERTLIVKPNSIHFTVQGFRTVTVENPNAVPVRIDDIAVVSSRGAANGYHVGDADCRRVLQPGKRCMISILATELALHSRAAIRIEIFHDGRSRPATVSATTASR